MNWIKQLWRRLIYLRHRDEMDAELAEEMRLHLELKRAEETTPGQASRQFGNMTALKEKSRDAWGWGWLDSLGQDLRYGWRNLMASRGFTATAVLSLALGIGANTAIFSILNAVMLRSLPVPDPHRLVKIQRDGADQLTNPLWEAFRDHQNACEGVLAYGDERFDLAREGEKQLISGLFVSGDYFNVLKVRAQLGRVFSKDDDIRGGGRSGPVAVISDAFWRAHYAADPRVIGKLLSLNGNSFEIVGVAAHDFTGLDVDRSFSVAIPLCTEPLFRPDRSALDERSFWWLRIVGRLPAGMTVEQAGERLKIVAPEIMSRTTPQKWDKSGQEGYAAASLTAHSIANGFSGMRREQKTMLFAMMGVVAMVLLIACANIANLLLARAAARQQEISVRLAIGAARKRLIRQLLTESLLLAALGIPFGLLLAKWGTRVLLSMLSSGRNPLQIDTSMDARVLLFTIGVSLFTGLFFGLAPALRATRISPNEILKQTTRSARGGGFKLGKVLVAGQVALSLGLLVAAGLFITTLRNLLNIPTGFDQKNVLIVDADFHSKIPFQQRVNQFNLLIERMRQTPGVISVAISGITPISGSGWNGFIFKEGAETTQKNKADMAWFNRVSPAFFETLQTPLIMGREFDARDLLDSPKVIILGEATARQFFGPENAVGKYVTMSAGGGKFDKYEVVGVARDIKYRELTEETRRTAFFPTAQEERPGDHPTFLIRTRGPIESAIPSLRQAIMQANPGISIQFRSFDRLVRDSLNQQTLAAGLAAFFGIIALLLAIVGLYGVTSYTAAQRKGEIGIRMALGAQRKSVIWLVLRDVAVILAIGSAFGIAISFGAGRFIGTLMYGIEPSDLGTFLYAALILIGAGIIAGLLPAVRASKLDPSIALRCE